MKTFWKIAGIATLVAILGIVAVGAVVLAQDAEDGVDWPFNFRTRMHEAIANILGVGVDEYDTAIETAREQVLDEALDEGWLTQDQADRMRERVEEGFGPGMRGGFVGPRGGIFGPGRGRGGLMAGPENSLITVVADQLGMTVDELLGELQDGKSIVDVAAEQGVELQAIADAFIAQQADWLAEAVEEGRLTQKQADWMLDQMEERILEHLDAPFSFFGGRGPGGCWHGGGRGGFGGFPGLNES
jgi:hypothetical protein